MLTHIEIALCALVPGIDRFANWDFFPARIAPVITVTSFYSFHFVTVLTDQTLFHVVKIQNIWYDSLKVSLLPHHAISSGQSLLSKNWCLKLKDQEYSLFHKFNDENFLKSTEDKFNVTSILKVLHCFHVLSTRKLESKRIKNGNIEAHFVSNFNFVTPNHLINLVASKP